ncbi:MAG: AAA family ATPase [Planctomycetota bacterium]|jgi:adenylate kinase
MRVVVTGMVGIDKKSYLEKLCQFSSESGKELLLCNVGDMMYAEAPDIPSGKILDVPMKRLSWLRRSVFKDIITKSRKASNLIVNTHATFRWRHGLFPAVDFDQMRQIDADMYICIIDGVAALHRRLGAEHTTEHTLKDLIVWREEELIGTEMLRNGINEKVPLYCLARGAEKDTIETLYKLLFDKDMKKAYLSFPMTLVTEMEEVQKGINQFRDLMKNYFICFDPADLEEAYLPHYAKKAIRDGMDYVEVTMAGGQCRLDLKQVLQIERDINSQTYARDFLLIDQSDMIISFIPTLADGKPAVSSGVERELQHAHEAAKEVYVIWIARHEPSVFITQTATKVFKDINSAIEFFKNKGYIQS